MQDIQCVGAYLPQSTTGTTRLVPGILSKINKSISTMFYNEKQHSVTSSME